MNNNRIELLDVVEVIEAICMYYPNNFKIKDLEDTAKAWYIPLQDSTRSSVMNNLLAHIKTNHFPPTIADLLAEQEKDKPDKYEHQRRAIPNVEETQLMLAEYANRPVATPEERQRAIAELAKVVESFKAGGEHE